MRRLRMSLVMTMIIMITSMFTPLVDVQLSVVIEGHNVLFVDMICVAKSIFIYLHVV